jgi:hypothetical protein
MKAEDVLENLRVHEQVERAERAAGIAGDLHAHGMDTAEAAQRVRDEISSLPPRWQRVAEEDVSWTFAVHAEHRSHLEDPANYFPWCHVCGDQEADVHEEVRWMLDAAK